MFQLCLDGAIRHPGYFKTVLSELLGAWATSSKKLRENNLKYFLLFSHKLENSNTDKCKHSISFGHDKRKQLLI